MRRRLRTKGPRRGAFKKARRDDDFSFPIFKAPPRKIVPRPRSSEAQPTLPFGLVPGDYATTVDPEDFWEQYIVRVVKVWNEKAWRKDENVELEVEVEPLDFFGVVREHKVDVENHRRHGLSSDTSVVVGADQLRLVDIPTAARIAQGFNNVFGRIFKQGR